MAVDALESSLGFLDHLPSGSLVIIKDTLHASGSFLVHHFLSRLLANKSISHRSGSQSQVQTFSSDGNIKKGDQTDVKKVCLVFCSDTLSQFVHVGRKLGGNLVSAAEKGQLRFIDGVSKPFVFEDGTRWGSKAYSGASQPSEGRQNQSRRDNQGASQGGLRRNLQDGLVEGLRDGLGDLSLSSPASGNSLVPPAPAVPSDLSGLHSDSPRNTPFFYPLLASPSSTHPALTNKQTLSSSPKPQQLSTPSARIWSSQFHPLQDCNNPSPLQTLYHQIATALGDDKSGQTESSAVTVIFNDLGGVETACQGASKQVLALLNRCRRLRASSGERASVVALIHDDQVAEGEKGLAAMLEHAADLVLQVDPLSTGSAADIHGQLTVTHRTDRWRLGLSGEMTTSRSVGTPAEQRFQFRLLETGVKLIHIGGSKGGA